MPETGTIIEDKTQPCNHLGMLPSTAHPKRYFFQLCFQGFQCPEKRWLIHAWELSNPSDPLCRCPLPQAFIGRAHSPPKCFPFLASEPFTHNDSFSLWKGAHVTRSTGTPDDSETRSPKPVSAFTDTETIGWVAGRVSDKTSKMVSVNTPGPVISSVVSSLYFVPNMTLLVSR